MPTRAHPDALALTESAIIADVLRLEEAQTRYEALRERDRTIASLQSKQRMIPVFERLFDDAARSTADARLRSALDGVREDARRLALELARATLLELEVHDLARISAALERFGSYLEATPSERLECCGDLLTFLREMKELDRPARPRSD
jgi:hypothetical protein